MRITVGKLRRIISEALMEANAPTNSPMNLADDMPHIIQYGGELGDDDGTGESGGDKNINELESSWHRPTGVKPTTMLGTSYLDDVDPENDEDFPTKRTTHITSEIFAPGFQDTPRYLNYNSEDIDLGHTNKETEAWNTCLSLYDKVRDTVKTKSMSDPQFIDFALGELAKDGTQDGIVTRMRFRLENENEG